MSAERFRDIFLGCLGESYEDVEVGRIVADRRDRLLTYLAIAGLDREPNASSGEQFLQDLDDSYRSAKPSEFYEYGARHDPSPVDPATIDAALRASPITLVVFPGIFSELIDTWVLEEVMVNPDSTFRREWHDAIARAGETPSGPELVVDEQFSLDSFDGKNNDGVARVRIGKLVEASSIDGDHGKPLVQVLLMRHARMSLETMDDIEFISTVLRRRLEKVFQIVGVPENMVFVGYSMGCPVALDVLAKAHQDDAPWIDNVRAMVSLAGVLYGSHVADDAMHPGSGRENNPSRHQVQLLEELGSALQELDGVSLLRRPDAIFANTRAWWRFLDGWRRANGSADLGEVLRSLPGTLRMGRNIDVAPLLGLLLKIGLVTFRPYNPFAYSTNVRRFKRLIAAALTSVENLSTNARLRWWRANTLPTRNVKYYALACTLTDETTGTPAGPLWINSMAYNPTSMDHAFLLKGYKEFVAATGLKLNDSQVALPRARFWPALAPLLNAGYRHSQLDSTFLGVLGVHHWGVTLRSVAKTRDKSTNPFPRAALVKAIAAQVALDLTAG